MFVRARRDQWWPLTPFVCESVVTLLSAASAFRRSVSLKLFERPPPGVLAPDMTEFARERTFITSGLDRVCQCRPNGRAGRKKYVQGVTLLFVLML